MSLLALKGNSYSFFVWCFVGQGFCEQKKSHSSNEEWDFLIDVIPFR